MTFGGSAAAAAVAALATTPLVLWLFFRDPDVILGGLVVGAGALPAIVAAAIGGVRGRASCSAPACHRPYLIAYAVGVLATLCIVAPWAVGRHQHPIFEFIFLSAAAAFLWANAVAHATNVLARRKPCA